MNRDTRRGFRRLRARLSWLLICGLLSGSLAACTLTYLPPLRDARVPEARLELSPESTLSVERRGVAEVLELTLVLTTVPEADWLAVQWFSPRNDEVAATSHWLTPETQALSTTLPSEVALSGGLWRAVVSYQGQLVRQVSLEVGGE